MFLQMFKTMRQEFNLSDLTAAGANKREWEKVSKEEREGNLEDCKIIL